jgi:lysophospholipase L1-like esterase
MRKILDNLKYVLIMILVLLVTFGAGFYVATNDVYPNEKIQSWLYQYIRPQSNGGFSTYYKDRTTFFSLNGTSSCPIVMLGDSITDFAEWHELLQRQDIFNRGIAGDTAFGILSRLDLSLKCQPKIVFLMMGVNDLKGGTPYIQLLENYKQVIDNIVHKDVNLVVQSTLYMAFDQNKTEATEVNRKVAQLNEAIHFYCEQRNITWVDLNKLMSVDGFLRTDLTHDGLHINGKGYQIWGGILQRILQEKLPGPASSQKGASVNLDTLQTNRGTVRDSGNVYL